MQKFDIGEITDLTKLAGNVQNRLNKEKDNSLRRSLTSLLLVITDSQVHMTSASALP